jgi:Cdc6-like AAA superfamily ATPase
MKSIKERYDTDNMFRSFVDHMVHAIEIHSFTPTEMREAALMASIIYDAIHIRNYGFETKEVYEHLREVEKIIRGEQ